MAITLRLATEADVPALARIGAAAFDPAFDPMTATLFPPHLQRPGHNAQEAWRALRKSARLKDEGSIIMVAVEAGDGDLQQSREEVVGFAWWTVPGAPSNASSVVVTGDAGLQSIGETFPPELDRAAIDALRAALLAGEQTIFGAAPRHWYELEVLAVHPHHHRKGVGRRLVQWGLDKGVGENKDVFLCATPSGQPLYHTMGFEEAGSFDMFGVSYKFLFVKNNSESEIGRYTGLSS